MTVQYIVSDPEGLAEKPMICHILGHVEINQAVQSWYRGREYGSCRVLCWDRILCIYKNKRL